MSEGTQGEEFTPLSENAMYRIRGVLTGVVKPTANPQWVAEAIEHHTAESTDEEEQVEAVIGILDEHAAEHLENRFTERGRAQELRRTAQRIVQITNEDRA